MAATVHAVLWLGSLIPHAESPWPSHIGIVFPFTLAGAGGAFGSLVAADRSRADRDRAVIRSSRVAFVFGALLYFGALLDQLVSGQ